MTGESWSWLFEQFGLSVDWAAVDLHGLLKHGVKAANADGVRALTETFIAEQHRNVAHAQSCPECGRLRCAKNEGHSGCSFSGGPDASSLTRHALMPLRLALSRGATADQMRPDPLLPMACAEWCGRMTRDRDRRR